MRVESAAMAKKKQIWQGSRRPDPNSRVGQLYDFLRAHRGQFVSIPTQFRYGGRLGQSISQLQNFYGLDIRNCRIEGNKYNFLYSCVGEWFGKDYVDYLAERIEK